jgi:twitching motility protein PilI
MARHREALGKLQARLAEQLMQAKTQVSTRAWLAVESAGMGFMLPLKEAGEIFSMCPVLSVPHTAPWFLGVANLRGHLHGVVDLARFLGIRSEVAFRDQSSVVLFSPAFELNCALVVDRLAGLKREDEIKLEADRGDSRPSFAADRYRDKNGRLWQEIRLELLASTDDFIRINR